MIYEVKVQYKKLVNEEGDEKNVKESFIIEEAESFADAEVQAYECVQGLGYDEVEVIAIKISKAKEIANKRQYDNDLIWVAELMATYLQDDGSEKAMKYKVFLFAKTFDAAKLFITEFSKQGYDMALVSLKLTNHQDVINPT